MLKATYDELLPQSDIRLIPIKSQIYHEYLGLVKKAHGPLYEETQLTSKRFNWNEGRTSYTMFD